MQQIPWQIQSEQKMLPQDSNFTLNCWKPVAIESASSFVSENGKCRNKYKVNIVIVAVPIETKCNNKTSLHS
jgi:hypothetical protein